MADRYLSIKYEPAGRPSIRLGEWDRILGRVDAKGWFFTI